MTVEKLTMKVVKAAKVLEVFIFVCLFVSLKVKFGLSLGVVGLVDFVGVGVGVVVVVLVVCFLIL